MKESVQVQNAAIDADAPEKENRQKFRKVKKAGRIGVLMFIMAMLMSISSFAADETSGIGAVTSALTTVTTLVTQVFTMITGNGLLAVFAAIGLLGAAITLFRRLKRASR